VGVYRVQGNAAVIKNKRIENSTTTTTTTKHTHTRTQLPLTFGKGENSRTHLPEEGWYLCATDVLHTCRRARRRAGSGMFTLGSGPKIGRRECWCDLLRSSWLLGRGGFQHCGTDDSGPEEAPKKKETGEEEENDDEEEENHEEETDMPYTQHAHVNEECKRNTRKERARGGKKNTPATYT
jgi:hypothetical protein